MSVLASTVGLKEEKMIFPYGILEGLGLVLDDPELPDHGPKWFDVLKQEVVESRFVDEAKKTFHRLGCKSIREYLSLYLEMDLLLLLRSSLLLLEKFEALTGISPIDCDKATLSSYSMYCSQMHLTWNKRPGAFCNNNPMLYNILRDALRGGLTMVTRTSVNAGEEEAINEPHLPPGDEGLKPKCLHYLDVSGLYSAAGESSKMHSLIYIHREKERMVERTSVSCIMCPVEERCIPRNQTEEEEIVTETEEEEEEEDLVHRLTRLETEIFRLRERAINHEEEGEEFLYQICCFTLFFFGFLILQKVVFLYFTHRV